MKTLKLIYEVVKTVIVGAYEVFKFLIDVPDLVSNVFEALPIQVASIATTLFVLAIAIIFLKFVK